MLNKEIFIELNKLIQKSRLVLRFLYDGIFGERGNTFYSKIFKRRMNFFGFFALDQFLQVSWGSCHAQGCAGSYSARDSARFRFLYNGALLNSVKSLFITFTKKIELFRKLLLFQLVVEGSE